MEVLVNNMNILPVWKNFQYRCKINYNQPILQPERLKYLQVYDSGLETG